HGLALWDAAAMCEREGSLDSDMRDVVFNDFGRLYARCPDIQTVLCNGATAHKLFVKSGWAGARQVIRMPSTSPAYTLPYEKKLEAWKKTLLNALYTP
ncbi:MAG: DNA-deoxyinosine glycosylase, partial [Christensenellales bacterium]